jgi:hypothetical protein
MIVVLGPLELVGLLLLVIAMGVLIGRIARTPTEPHPTCGPCGAFATYTIEGQPFCEDHARAAVKVGWHAEPIR